MDTTPTMRPCWVEIDTRALEDNYRFLRQLAGEATECLAIVKANAYGHGLELCARAAVRAGARWLGVTSVEEGVAARAACPDARIVVMAGVFPGQARAVYENRLTPVVWDFWQLDELENFARAHGCAAGSIRVHLEIDTGMSRQGVAPDQLAAWLARFTAESAIAMEAVMTHLYGSDEAHGETTTHQLAILEESLGQVAAALPSRQTWLSVGASAALLGGAAEQIRGLAARVGLTPMLRLGLALFGLTPPFDPAFDAGDEPEELEAASKRLKPVLEWKTRVVTVREVPPGANVGYNGTFVATEPMRLALIAVGYADGLDRRLGNRFSLLVRGQRAPLVGRVSMDQAVVDVTEIADVTPGDEVVILGAQGGETITAFDHAEVAGTIPWEVFTRIGARVRRMEAGSL
ncbi:MAG TPA: alanine racemase [Terracidiphilus sp.]